MSLTSALYGATTGLSVTQSQMDLVSRNVMNVNTEGYTRKTLQQETKVVGGHAYGLFTSTPQRTIDHELQRQYRESSAHEAQLGVQNTFLTQIQTIFGRPDSAVSLANYATSFKNAFIEASATPEDPAMLQAVVSSATQMADNLNSIHNKIQELRTSSDNSISALVEDINVQVEQVDALNKQITQARALGHSIAELEDKRDMIVDNLSKQADITYFTRSDGQMVLNMANGQALLDGQVFKLEYNSVPMSSSAWYPGNINPITLNGRDITATISGGELKGFVEMRDTILPQAQAQIDELAGAMLDAMQTADMPILIDSANTPYSHPADVVGVAGRISINPDFIADPWRVREGGAAATESNTPGDPSHMKNAIDAIFSAQLTMRTTGLGPGGNITSMLEGSASVEGYSASFIQFQASQKANNDRDFEFQGTVAENLRSQTAGISGVNLDQELSMMIMYQNTYGANARTITTLQKMMDDLLSIV